MAVSCIDVFPTVLSSPYNDGIATLHDSVALSKTTNGKLDIGVVQYGDNPKYCEGKTCKDSGHRTQSLTGLDIFKLSPLPEDQIPNNPDISSPLTGGSYETINVGWQQSVRFQSDDEVIYIETLNATGSESSVTFDNGVYWIGEFNFGSNMKVVINGKVTLIINKSMMTNSSIFFNVDGVPNDLLLIGYSDITFGSDVQFNGLIYSKENVVLNSPGNLNAAINGKLITVGSQVTVTYDPDSIESANFNGFCGDASTLSAPRLEYRFDECRYTGNNGDVIDQIGSFNGNSNGIPTPVNDAIINKSLDLSADNTSDWIAVPRGAVDGLNNFSVSVWFKTSVNKSQQEIFHALGKNTSDDELEIFLKNKKTVYIKVRDDSEELDSDIELTDNRWHHLVLTRADEDVCLFIDGVKQDCDDDDVGDGQLSVPFANAIVIGQEQDSFGGDFSKSQNFEGQLDEFKIFDVKLTDTQISSIYQHELAGNNFDGSTRQPDFCSAPEPELEYRFDEASWSGNSGEVDDNSRHELNGHAVGDTTTITAGQICRAGTFDGTGDYINVNRINSYLSSSASLSFWIKSDQYGNNTAWYAPGIMGVEEVGGGDDIFWGYLDASGHIKIQKGNGSSARSNTKISSNSWHHVVLTRDSSTGVVQVFVDGKLEDSANSETGDVSTAFSSIGRIEHSFSSSNFMGELDELLVYNSVISASDVFSIYTNQLNGDNYDGSPRNCPTMSIHHYEIEHDGQGLTCEAETITIKACTNAACSTLSSEEVTLNVTATGSRDSVTDSISFTGTGTANIRYTFPESTLLLLSKQGTNSTVCSDGRSTNCNLVFANAGFRFISGNRTTLPNQTSGTVFGDTLQIQAVKDTNGVCTGLFSGKRNVNLSQENVNPGGTKGLNFSINDQNIAKHPSITSTRLNFGANSIAEIPTPIYHDAGKIRLHANYKVGEGDYSGVTLFGSSNPFWVSPAERQIRRH